MATQPTVPNFTPGQRIPMSYEDFLRLVDEDAHAEWVDGAAIIFMPPSARHQALIGFLHTLIAIYIDLFDLRSGIRGPNRDACTPRWLGA